MTQTTDAGTTPAGVATVGAVVLDVPDVAGATAFWRGILQAPEPQDTEDDWVTLETPEGWEVCLQHAPDLVRAQWPGQAHPQQLHLDLRVPDVAAATSAAVAQGATLLRENPTWNTLADPAGHPFDLCASDEVDRTTVWGVTVDVPDAAAAARFWAALLGEEIAYEGDGMAMLGGPRTIMFQQVAGYVAPGWPDPGRPQQLHLDLRIPPDDPDAAEATALRLGARRLPGGGTTFRVFADPDGHPFCLCWG